jgi:hypothetical protein
LSASDGAAPRGELVPLAPRCGTGPRGVPASAGGANSAAATHAPSSAAATARTTTNLLTNPLTTGDPA